MKRTLTIFMLIGALLHIAAVAPIGVYRQRPVQQKQDTIVKLVPREGDNEARRKMSTSAYPVQLNVVGNAVRVQSPENQILPVYTANGAFYLFMRLNKGVNWLNGLPQGRYFINNRLVIIK